MSPLSWGRGLKLENSSAATISSKSSLAWGRGLKPTHSIKNSIYPKSPPRVGAWIETSVIRNFVPPKFRKVKQPGKGKVKQPTKYTIT